MGEVATAALASPKSHCDQGKHHGRPQIPGSPLPPAPPCLSFPTGEFGISSHHNRANIGHTANGGGLLGGGEPLPPLGEEAGKLHPGADGAKIGIRIKETTKGLKK